MTFKHTIKINLNILKNEQIEIEGITFSNIAYLRIIIDGVNLIELEQFQDSFAVYEELKKSSLKSGEYLIFTSISGIADDAGWDYVKVEHSDDCIKWFIERDNECISYVFDREEYVKEILNLETKLNNLESSIKLEPKYVIYPESA